MSEERRQAVLRAIVEDYVATHEPVGSKALADSKGLGVSSATIRNDMAILEEEGLIAQPHTSAGRIPTDAGYRSFVDHLAASAIPDPHKRAIATFLSDAVDLNDVVERSVRLLSQLTRQVAVVQYPSLRESAVRRVELVRLGLERALVVVVSADARVEQQTIPLGEATADEAFERAVREVNEVGQGLSGATLATALGAWAAQPGQVPWAATLADVVVGATRAGTVERVMFAGTSNLARAGSGLEADTIAPVLDALEEQVLLLRLLHEMADQGDDVSVRIGAETHHEALRSTSIVAANYGRDTLSLVGALGPTRMDYPGTMAAVRAVARYLSRVVEL
ncbi:heat-inducible transcriptional repressor HrcA [Demequina sp. SYSU T00039]|uniref:Heat-inducible transcription repressor HrcA n=1 Tax=Demequina lignilytica TaxID=3051663 RepID=A0AAW7M142_9MICO|nr:MULTISPECIES: heat-inducible transcriptional repressor HrcA [unclassified Demequina]MDN4478464.1 heat-inducible transcriptional repressor HrcA [Demequina sp. SYSU T00039-1]MDN4487029.1 heat-inducible transcriptional repressor HrcA [Demequina sp. SYSU T00039]MDN4489740.1 heat-inducible transcriptional repressor HrcA [Demequina sp. SYSU T00068]